MSSSTAPKRWEPKSTRLLRQYAHEAGGTFQSASLKGIKYTPQAAKVNLSHGRGELKVRVVDSSNQGSSGSQESIVVTYDFRPRRKLKFYLISKKRLALHAFDRDYRETTMPNHLLAKMFKAGASHPSILRAILKYEPFADDLLVHPFADIRLKIKGNMATLAYKESVKKSDVEMIQDKVDVVKHLIEALYEQSVVYEGTH